MRNAQPTRRHVQKATLTQLQGVSNVDSIAVDVTMKTNVSNASQDSICRK